MLGRFTSLTNLSLDGHNYGLAVLGDLLSLEALTLRSITTPDLGYLAPLQRLRFLDIKLGGIRSFQGVEGKDSIKYLELLRIRELSDAGVVGALPGLQHLSLESLPRITSLPRLDRSRALRRVVLQNLKGLHDFTAFEAAPALEQFALIQGDKQQPSQLLPILRNPAVRGAKGHFGSARKDSAFERLREAHCKQDWDIGSSFEYR